METVLSRGGGGGGGECNYTRIKKSRWDRMMRLKSFETQEGSRIVERLYHFYVWE